MTSFKAAISGPQYAGWVPKAAQHYISHTTSGFSIRWLAKQAGCHASTVMRQIRRLETRRDDPLVDGALALLATPDTCIDVQAFSTQKESSKMTKQLRFSTPSTVNLDRETVEREGRRILRRLSEPGACLAVAKDMEKAVVVREACDGRTTRTAVIDRPIAQAMALKEWIACENPGRISRYTITSTGRAALKQLLKSDNETRTGFAEGAVRFVGSRPSFATKDAVQRHGLDDAAIPQNATNESPVASMARRKDREGNPFLCAELVCAAERLREDFEVARMGSGKKPDWDLILQGDAKVSAALNREGDGAVKAQQKVSDALAVLGPGLGDVVLRVCCFLEGLEAAERRMGWSARSGKVVLRIALQRLKLHYDNSKNSAMIG